MRGVKQLIYGSFYLAILLLLGAGAYFYYLRPSLASCVNGQKDFNEIGVDCGGVCANSCLPDLDPLEVAAVSVAPLGSDLRELSVLAEVRNRNQDFGALAEYSLYIKDQSVKNGSFYIAPGEIEYLGFPAVADTASSSAAELRISKTEWIPAQKLRQPDLAVNISGVSQKDDLVTVSGTLVNKDPSPVDSAELLALFYDANGKMIGLSRTTLDSLAQSESRAFSILHPKLDSLAEERTRVVANAFIIQN